jgi:hypothetical protein
MERYDLVVSELHNLGHVACLLGQPERARSLFTESLQLGDQIGNHANRPYNLIGLGRVAAALGQAETAATLLGAGMLILRAQGKALVPLLRPAVEATLAETRVALGDARFDAAFAKGEGLSATEALRMVANV